MKLPQIRLKKWIRYGLLSTLIAVVIACQLQPTKPLASNSVADSGSEAISAPKESVSPTETTLPTQPVSTAVDRLVDIHSINPKIRLDIRYATPNNFTRRPLYSQARCLLRAAIAADLAQVQVDLESQGLGLKVYDCYRPLAVQRKMWQIMPDSRYVANPAVGSRHNRGSAVDVTLVDREGQELEMPTDFDDFSDRAHLDYAGGSAQSRRNRQILHQTMTQHGFIALPTEWWHFDGQNWQQYQVMDVPLENVKV
ncbi:D-alanyl-D-alanine dipeptidase [Pantanalinema rosaneae CENA516]|uniref:D-alanyl-D-alanine dipeptidase n=1 Tax=Pantanalinema rosaneae TaxID=1620701 RepID=UPI003D6E0FF7